MAVCVAVGVLLGRAGVGVRVCVGEAVGMTVLVGVGVGCNTVKLLSDVSVIEPTPVS